MIQYDCKEIPKSERIPKLVKTLFAKMPEIEAARAELLTESFALTEGEPLIVRKAKAFYHILDRIPIVIRDDELIVGSSTIAPRGCQTFPEFSFEWLEQEFDTVEHRKADPFYISQDNKERLKKANAYWKGKTTSDLAYSYMAEETKIAMEHNIFTPGNYFYNGVGHVTVQYDKVLKIGYQGIIKEVEEKLEQCNVSDADYCTRSRFYEAVILSCKAVIRYANRYSELAQKMAIKCSDEKRKQELLHIADNCKKVPEHGASSFYEACQSFWFVQQLLQMESSGHSISPGRFDQYMYPYYEKDIKAGVLSKEEAQEYIDCIFVKLNDLNKCRDAVSAEGFAGYSLFQNLIVGGQTKDGLDATNDLSFMCITASFHVFLPQPSLSIRVWNNSPEALLLRAAELTRTGIGLPAYYNDEVIIPSLLSRGLTLEDARDYNIIGCVEPQKAGKTDGWHDAAFFNLCRPLELVFSNGMDKGKQISILSGELREFKTFDDFKAAYQKQLNYQMSLLVNADNAIDTAHAQRCPLPLESCMVDDCIERGKSVQEGGAVYNFTGPQGFGIANMADSMYAIKKLVYDEKKYTLCDFKEALIYNYGEGFDESMVIDITKQIVASLEKQKVTPTPQQISQIVNQIVSQNIPKDKQAFYKQLHKDIEALPKYGNDVEEVDLLAREIAYYYTKQLPNYKNPRGGIFQAGLYPVSANVPLGAQTGATPDGRFAHRPIADGVSPSPGKDLHGPTATANSVSKLDHGIASNGTLFNQKFHPSALSGDNGLFNFINLIRAYFDQKGSHMQFNVVDKKTLLDAQQHPKNYPNLIVRVAGYSALFTTLSKSLQDDIISRTEQGF